jgi:lipopolysaccharide export system protein LptA
MFFIFRVIVFVCCSIACFAQTPIDTIAKNAVKIKYIHSDSLVGTMLNGVPYNRLLGNVSLEHNGTTLHCDSAYLYQEKNFVEAFSNVQIQTNNGTTITSNYLKYTGNNNTALLKKEVVIVDGINQLESEEVTYNTQTKIAKYNNGGILQSESTRLSSDQGIYYGKTKDAYFKGSVVVTDPKYNVDSKEIKYNTVTKFVTFLDESTIVSDNTTLEGRKGTFDAQHSIGNFSTRSIVSNDEQQITANTMHYEKTTGISNANGNVVIDDFKNDRKLLANKTDYNEKTGYMKATGNVVIYDEQEGRTLLANMAEYTKPTTYTKVSGKVELYDAKQRRTVFADTIEYIKKSKYTLAKNNVIVMDSVQQSILQCKELQINQVLQYSLAKGNPILRSLLDKDSLFMRADSFFSAPSVAIDTIKNKIVPRCTAVDSLATEDNDTIKQTLIGIGNVILYTDSMQAISDSISYSGVDSVFRLYKKPMLWTRSNQAIADTIYAKTINNKIAELNLKANASMINSSAYKNIYDQIYGNSIDGFIVNDEIEKMFVDGNAQSIYYTKNESELYLGQNKSISAQMKILFKERKVNKIIFYTEPTGVFTPIFKLTEADKLGSGFVWYPEKRPKNKEAVLGKSK